MNGCYISKCEEALKVAGRGGRKGAVQVAVDFRQKKIAEWRKPSATFANYATCELLTAFFLLRTLPFLTLLASFSFLTLLAFYVLAFLAFAVFTAIRFGVC